MSLLPSELGWERWQRSTVSQRLLSHEHRQEGYTVLRLPPSLRTAFLQVASVFALYDAQFQHAKWALSPDQLAAFVAWDEATRALLDVLKKG